jgi:uncharacterized protein YjdB
VTEAKITTVEVAPNAPTLPVGTVSQLTATAVYSDGTRRNVTNDATWMSTTPAVVAVDTMRFRGRITAVSQGKTMVTAFYMGIEATAYVTVSPAVLSGISVSPAGAMLPAGTSQQFTAKATRSDGTSFDVTALAMWSSDAPMVASVAAAGAMRGQVRGISGGTANIRATFMGVSGSASVTVTDATIASIQVTPFAPTLSTGSTQPFTATAVFSDGSQVPVTGGAVWKSSDPRVAEVGTAGPAQGLVTTLAKGTTEISATYAGLTGTSTLLVTEAKILQIQVTPFDPTIPVGFPQALTATAIYSDGSNRNITSLATWTSSAPFVADVSNADGSRGQAKAFRPGDAVIGAQRGGRQGKALLLVK